MPKKISAVVLLSLLTGCVSFSNLPPTTSLADLRPNEAIVIIGVPSDYQIDISEGHIGSNDKWYANTSDSNLQASVAPNAQGYVVTRVRNTNKQHVYAITRFFNQFKKTAYCSEHAITFQVQPHSVNYITDLYIYRARPSNENIFGSALPINPVKVQKPLAQHPTTSLSDQHSINLDLDMNKRFTPNIPTITALPQSLQYQSSNHFEEAQRFMQAHYPTLAPNLINNETVIDRAKTCHQ
jgi:hypothetical protein